MIIGNLPEPLAKYIFIINPPCCKSPFIFILYNKPFSIELKGKQKKIQHLLSVLNLQFLLYYWTNYLLLLRFILVHQHLDKRGCYSGVWCIVDCCATALYKDATIQIDIDSPQKPFIVPAKNGGKNAITSNTNIKPVPRKKSNGTNISFHI